MICNIPLNNSFYKKKITIIPKRPNFSPFFGGGGEISKQTFQKKYFSNLKLLYKFLILIKIFVSIYFIILGSHNIKK